MHVLVHTPVAKIRTQRGNFSILFACDKSAFAQSYKSIYTMRTHRVAFLFAILLTIDVVQTLDSATESNPAHSRINLLTT